MKHLAFALVSLTIAAQYASAADSPFAGTWKFNSEKSKLTGDTFTYTATSTGFRYSDGGTFDYDFAIDGKDYPTFSGRKVSWTKAGENAWDSVLHDGNDVVLSKVHRVLSADGKKLTISYTNYKPDGTTGGGSDEYVRISGASGLAGKWKDVKSKQDGDSVEISVPAPGQVTIVTPSYKATASGTLDGTPIAVTGPSIPSGLFTSMKAISPSKWTYTTTLNGKIIYHGVQTVSADGKTMTDTSWLPGKESEKEVDVYDRE
jgi:hypothetical protein